MNSARLGRPTGRTFVGGLPSSPRARSTGRNDVRGRETDRYRSSDRAREDDYHPYRDKPSHAPAPTRTTAPTPSMRSYRSMTSMRSSHRGGPSPLSYTDVPDVPPRRSNESYNSSSSTGSSPSTSTSGSSLAFLDRMKGRGGYGNEYGYGNGYELSRTSVEEGPEEGPKEEGREWGGWLRQQMPAMPEREYGETKDRDGSLPGGRSGYGLSLWSRVATAASTLTINVSKAWTSRISGHPDEQTPPGEESRLTRVLKAYHIDKARDPNDLPEWLFEEHERRPIGRSGTSFRRQHQEGDEYGEHETGSAAASTSSASGRGLRDVYDAAAIASRRQHEGREPPLTRGRQPYRENDAISGSGGLPPSKASHRLRALRDEKRKVALRNASVSSLRLSGRVSDEWLEREERGRRDRKDRTQGDGPHRRAPSLPASVRPPQASPRSSIRKI